MRLTWAISKLRVVDGFCFYRIRRDKPLLKGFAASAKVMYASAYDPALHEGLSTDDMGLDPRFAVYEDFLIQLVEDDFGDYAKPETKRDIFFVTRGASRADFSNIAGFSALLPREGSHYYLDHFGVSTLYQKHGIGGQLLALWQSILDDWRTIELDTRLFNKARNWYAKHGFSLQAPHPVGKKEGRYLHFRLEKTEPTAGPA